MRANLNDYEKTLVAGWEATYKKSQLTLWLLVSLRTSPKHMTQMKDFISETTNGTVNADDKSMYRALRKLNEASMIDYREVENPLGPRHKVFMLTPTGKRVLAEFIRRNISDIFLAKKNYPIFQNA